MDEADSIVPTAQHALAALMDMHHESTRFVLICNDATRIIGELKSRCIPLAYTVLPDGDMARRLRHVAEAEGLPPAALSEEAIKALLFVAEGDMRKALNSLQAVCTLSLATHRQERLHHHGQEQQQTQPPPTRIVVATAGGKGKDLDPQVKRATDETPGRMKQVGATAAGLDNSDCYAVITADQVFAIADQPHPLCLMEIVTLCCHADLYAARAKLEWLWNQGFQSTDVIEALSKVLRQTPMSCEHTRLSYLRQFALMLHRQSTSAVEAEVSLTQLYGLLGEWCRHSLASADVPLHMLKS
jgi:DNA polymerase III delta prime subunit